MSGAARDFDIVIVGAGIIGTVMASLLAARKIALPGRVAIVAGRFAAAPPPPEWDVRVFALSRASERLLRLCGVWDALPADRVSAYERMCVWDAGGEPLGKGSLCFDCAEMGEPNLGFIVEGRALQWQCLLAARSAGTVLLEAELSSIVADDVDVAIRLGDGRTLRSQLLIGADGPESTTRTLLGIETAGHAYQQDALVAHVETQKPHRNTAWQRFLDTGPVAFLPMPDGRSSIVWSATLTEAERLRALTREQWGAALTVASGGILGDCVATALPVSYPLKLQYAVSYTRPRAVLLGDAAHVVHPLAGQGMNLGLLDCAELAAVLAEGGSAGYFGEQRLLRRYERRRRSENLVAAAALDGLERLFASRSAWTGGLRRAGLGMVNRMAPLKQELAQRALGLAGDVPDFLKGEPASLRK